MPNLSEAKEKMLRENLAARGITDPAVLSAFRTVHREEFIPARYRDLSYADMPLDIGEGQTISQPYTVALMTQLLDPRPGDVVLEIGTGSGYQAAILSKLVKQVYSIERFEDLAETAARALRQTGCLNVKVLVGDGSGGLPAEAPFDGIIVTAGAPKIPQPLLDQLKVGGRLVVPIGSGVTQEMTKIIKTGKGFEKKTYPGFRFVPLIGKEGFPG
jgi:protein-L-isoaspartate(D-aspartate) O-methyltransferase